MNTKFLKTILYNGYKIYYYASVKPNTETIVFFHAAFTDHRLFNKQFEGLKDQYSIIAIDMLGHGQTQPQKTDDKIDKTVDHINEILKIENISKVHLVGVSMGSLMAQYYALQFPESSTSLTILGGYDISGNNKEINKAQRSESVKWMIKALFSIDSFHKYIAKVSVSNADSQELVYKMAKAFKRKSFKYLPGLGNVLKERANVTLACPTLILVGENDLDLAKEAAKQLHENTPNSRFKTIANAGHCANLDMSDNFNIILKNFIVDLELVAPAAR